ncbi:MAG TPA: DoxX family membrane protein [Chitinophagales bacterium]|nr:DoxX family membrane protein [Chitinophagales bacterium]
MPAVAKHIARILIGITFITSAVLKMIGVDAFEVYVFSTGWFGLPFATILARLIISVEGMLGLLLLLQYRYDVVKKITTGTLAVFSIYLIYLISTGRTENCQCFGTMISLTPIESLVKNLALFVFLFISWKCPVIKIPQQASIALFVIVFTLVLPSFISPPDFIVKYPDMPESTLQIAEKRIANNPVMQANQVTEGKKLVCMFSTHCSYCKHAAEKVSIIAERLNLDDEVVYVFTGDEQELPQFWQESRSNQFHYFFLPMRNFFEIAGPSVPSIYLVDGGKVTTHFHYRNIDETAIKSFFE